MTADDFQQVARQQLVPRLRELQQVAEQYGVPFLATVFDEQGQRVLHAAYYLPSRCAEAARRGVAVQDMAGVRGQGHVRRALEVAAAGGHSLLLVGPKGAGKQFLASTLPSILPPQVEGQAAFPCQYRAPHHLVGVAALIGGGHPVRPGEVTLAHGGVLYLEDLPAFAPRVLAALSRVVEERVATISQAQGTTVFPASFQLVGSMAPCQCGFYTDSVRACTCRSEDITRYQQRVAGVVSACFQMSVEVPRVDYDQLEKSRAGEGSWRVCQRVQAARLRQQTRLAELEIGCNAHIPAGEVERLCAQDAPAQRLFTTAVQQLHLAAQEAYRLLMVARTIADLDASDAILAHHVAEAVQYRPRVPR